VKFIFALSLGVLLTAAAPAAPTNSIAATNAPVVAPGTNDPVAAKLRALMLRDEAVTDEIDRMIKANDKFAQAGAGEPPQELNRKIRQLIDPVRASYEDFIKRHPDNVEARLAIASLLEDIHDEEAVFLHLDKARELSPTNSAVWNNLANYYGHNGEVKKAFDYYTKAIELNPTEPVYYHNFGTTVYLFRKDAREHYGITETEVFEKALDLYANAMRHDPTNFVLASDVAQTYYGIRPMRTEAALQAWTNALQVATSEAEREWVYIHFARVKLHAGRYPEVRAHLDAVTNAHYAELKNRLERNLQERLNPPAETNAPPVVAPANETPAPASPAK